MKPPRHGNSLKIDTDQTESENPLTSLMAESHQRLANNVSLEPQPKAEGGVVMQVNTYVPHYQRLPLKLKQEDLNIFENAIHEKYSEAEERYA